MAMTMEWARAWLAISFIILNLWVGRGASLYFSQPEVNISRTFLPQSGFLYVVKAIANSDEDGQIKYSISGPIPNIDPHQQTQRGKRKNQNNQNQNNGVHGGGGDPRGNIRCAPLVIDANLGNISVVLPQTNEGKVDLSAIDSLFQVGLSCRYKVQAVLEESSSSNSVKHLRDPLLKTKTNKKKKRNNSYAAAAAGDADDDYGDDDKVVEMTLNLGITSPLTILLDSSSRPADCRTLSKKELCFGGTNHLGLRVMENAPVTPVASLGSLPGMCGTLKVSYNVSVDQGVVSATKVRNYEPLPDILTTKSDLDRESVEVYNLSVNCILESDSNKIEVIKLDGELRVLDENDNVLMTEDGLSEVDLFISLSDHNFKITPGNRLTPTDHTELLASDRDTLGVNNFKIYNVNDTKGLLEFDFVQYSIAPKELDYTAVVLKIMLSQQVQEIVKVPWEGYYCVVAVMNDSTVVPAKRGQDLKFNVCVSWGQTPHPPKASEKPPSRDELLERLSNHVSSGKLSRAAQKYAPVLYPFPDMIEDVSEPALDVEFTLTDVIVQYSDDSEAEFDWTANESSNNNNEAAAAGATTMSNAIARERVFEVSPKMGIVYLTHPEFIRNLTVHSFQLIIRCNASEIPAFNRNVTITLESSTTPPGNETFCDDELCSVHADSKSCELSCGFGSSGKCEWRHETGFNNSLGNDDSLEESQIAPRYPTCSPRLEMCPDGRCDELEKMFPHLCPQDCATELRGFGRLLKHSNGKSYGINGEYCKGVATCQDPHTCSCAHLPPPIVESSLSHESRSPSSKNLAFSVTDKECGQECIMMYIGIALIASVAIGISCYAWRARVDKQKKARQLDQSVMMTANGVELPFGENTGHGTLMSDADYLSRGMNHSVMLSDDHHQFSQNQIVQFEVDSKWEISREDLMLEHVLGEGQFGRVLKGRLHAHSVGQIPVAVKMLKVDNAEGSKSLWQEFMAEFSLLKQVDHPHVIKLLGACTTNGGPPYLVMEYAEYGALRSFLRKCRRVEKINGSNPALHWEPCEFSSSPPPPITITGSDALDTEYRVTPREVLGFSWQIAKGMAYLSDMKMVHRDLAARNILLTKERVCKISDFGLTRDIYVDDAYQKKSKDRVPVKWLAPECLADELYTTKSDVWAFGVLVWELTTLGASPYPGVQTEQLYSLLNTGYRMQQPQNCSNELYSLMRKCWAYQPPNRPTFHQIVRELTKMMEDGIDYLVLDCPSVSNPGYDYFSHSDQTGSEMVNLSPTQESPISEVRPHSRRKLSMENLRLIDYEISTNDEFLSNSKRGVGSSTSSTAVPHQHHHQHPRPSCSTSSGIGSGPGIKMRHTYINEPNPSLSEQQDCSGSQVVQVHQHPHHHPPPPQRPSSSTASASGYESPIRHNHATSVAV